LELVTSSPLFYISFTMKKNTVTAYVIRLPRKGNFAPLKLGCMETKFIRTKMPNGMEDMWIAGSKIYTDQEEFNKDSQRIMPSAYKFNLMAFAYVFDLEVTEEKPVEPAPEPAPEPMSITGLSPSLPTPPPVAQKKVAKKKAASKKQPKKKAANTKT